MKIRDGGLAQNLPYTNQKTHTLS